MRGRNTSAPAGVHKNARVSTHTPDKAGVLAYAGLILLGAAAGLFNGLLGAAGGILLALFLPHMTLPSVLMGKGEVTTLEDRRDVLATSMAVMLPVSAVSFVTYLARGIRPHFGLSVSILLPAALGGVLGAYLLTRLPAAFLRRLFALLVLIAGLRMLL